ncbi:N-acetyltransferase [Nitratireductor mangrovi]|uniref:N-acetyltransferase n=1 Tax=Nitratireductor mangrovi TaxID=2599600 RepID=A0A5B8L2A0_9HYPH|nr:N-acetyltransferase [Nitratireductor mangrovi]QDZ02086.1 N-acetyltransferase [Nitratireductor mangrovi]
MLDIAYLAETAAHDDAIEDINQEAFGPGRHTRAAYKIREGGPHERALSFVALHDDQVIATVRLTRVAVGKGRSLLLGPLAVKPAFKDMGIGRKLVRMAVEAAHEAAAGSVILVGDEPYYGPLGFRKIPPGQVTMPRPVDPHRLLIHEIAPGALELLQGAMVHADLARQPA